MLFWWQFSSILSVQYFCLFGFFLDYDECNTATDDCVCSRLPGCISTCTNTPLGSYTCGCIAGFTLAIDERTCEGYDFCFLPPRLSDLLSASLFTI